MGRAGRWISGPFAVHVKGQDKVSADLVVVGSGLFGLTIAERAANDLGSGSR